MGDGTQVGDTAMYVAVGRSADTTGNGEVVCGMAACSLHHANPAKNKSAGEIMLAHYEGERGGAGEGESNAKQGYAPIRFLDLHRVNVRAEWRRMGVAVLLMRHLEGLARGVGCDEIHATTTDHQTKAHGMYRRLGYKKAQDIDGVYHGNSVMRRLFPGYMAQPLMVFKKSLGKGGEVQQDGE